jgi:predicted metal-binding protein
VGRRHVAEMLSDDTILAVPAPWRDVAMLCGKCSRKLNGGFGKKGKHDLADVLKSALKRSGRRRALRVLEVGCLGLCPKRAVTVVTTAQPDQVLAISAGTDPTLVLARLSPAAAATT